VSNADALEVAERRASPARLDNLLASSIATCWRLRAEVDLHEFPSLAAELAHGIEDGASALLDTLVLEHLELVGLFRGESSIGLQEQGEESGGE